MLLGFADDDDVEERYDEEDESDKVPADVRILSLSKSLFSMRKKITFFIMCWFSQYAFERVMSDTYADEIGVFIFFSYYRNK